MAKVSPTSIGNKRTYTRMKLGIYSFFSTILYRNPKNKRKEPRNYVGVKEMTGGVKIVWRSYGTLSNEPVTKKDKRTGINLSGNETGNIKDGRRGENLHFIFIDLLVNCECECVLRTRVNYRLINDYSLLSINFAIKIVIEYRSWWDERACMRSQFVFRFDVSHYN